jgi:hypothetical protein|tara:strand:- start:361 stop:1011 length:651 start_codon:yes stop_codon:yes gene_type:complete
MELKLNIPTKLSEITLRQYKKFIEIGQKNDDTTFIQGKMIEIFCGVSHKFATLMKYNDVEEITGDINKLLLQQPSLVSTFKMNGIEYGFVPDLDNMTLGEYIDIDTYTGEYDNIEIAMNVLYRPIIKKIKNKYIIEDYNPENKDKMLDMPMDAVVGSLFFFLNLGLELSEITLSYLTNPKKIHLEEYKILQENMDGIHRFLPYLEETLQELKISLN